MKGFVEACRAEWKRIGVADAVANEMAADLAADLAEAEADGVSAEEVLGNGVFDAPSFAASWAAARGVVTAVPDRRQRVRAWALVAAAAASLVVLLAGVALLGPVQHASVAFAAVKAPFAPGMPGFGLHRVTVFGPGIFHGVTQNSALRPVGLVLAVLGVAGLAVTLWTWRRRRSDPPGADDPFQLPSYL